MKTYPIRAIFKHILKERQRQLTKNKAELKYSFGSVLVEELHKFGFSGNYYDIERILNTNIKNKTLRRIGNAAKKQGKVALLSHFVWLFEAQDYDYRKVMFFEKEPRVSYFKKTVTEIIEIREEINERRVEVFNLNEKHWCEESLSSILEGAEAISIEEGESLKNGLFLGVRMIGAEGKFDREFIKD